MKAIRSSLLYFLFLTVLFTQVSSDTNIDSEYFTESKRECYKFKPSDFFQTIDHPQSLHVSVKSQEGNAHYIYIDDTEDFRYSYECNTSKDDVYTCFGYETKDRLSFYLKDDMMYLNIDYIGIQIDRKTINTIKSKTKTFSQAFKVPCYLSLKPQFNVENIQKGSKKENLLHSININDIIIRDIDYHKDFAIAVGEDYSPSTRELQSISEYYKTITLRSFNGGKTWEKIAKVIEHPSRDLNVIVLEKQRVIVISSDEDNGGIIYLSSDGGQTWKIVYNNHHIESIQKGVNGTLLAETLGPTLISSDSGNTWKEIPIVKEDEDPNKQDEKNNQIEALKKSDISILSMPHYKVNYENNALMLKHQKSSYNCNEFNMPLTYNSSSNYQGILGAYWSLGGVENRIFLENKERIVYFDSFNGISKTYTKDPQNSNIFRSKDGNRIEKNTKGYYLECAESSYHFDKNGYIKKIVYPEKEYDLHYEDTTLHRITENHKGNKRTYITFKYLYEGIQINFHIHSKSITFILNDKDLLSEILEHDKRIFNYRYHNSQQLRFVNYMQEESGYETLLYIYYDNNNDRFIEDLRELRNGTTTIKRYRHISNPKEHLCIVSTLNKSHYGSGNRLSFLEKIDIDVYQFNYYDKAKNKLASTSYNNEKYGFDEMNHVNFHNHRDTNTSVVYYPFHKIKRSIIKTSEHSMEYHFDYSNDKDPHVIKIITPKDTIYLHYNEKKQIKEMKSDLYHMRYQHNNAGKPKKIIIIGKGEMNVTYDKDNQIADTAVKTYQKHINSLDITQEVSNGHAHLMKSLKEGSIQSYPKWLW